MYFGIFVIFNIISPFINNKEDLSLASSDITNIEKYLEGTNKNIVNNNTIDNNNENKITNSEELNQTSMDKRIQTLYQEELEKDIIKKVEEQGYIINDIKVEAEILKKDESNNNDNETGIKKIRIEIEKKIEENKEEGESNEENINEQEETLENKIVTGVQRIKEIDISMEKSQEKNSEEKTENERNNKITKSDIQNLKKFLIEEYGVNEKCLEIN